MLSEGMNARLFFVFWRKGIMGKKGAGQFEYFIRGNIIQGQLWGALFLGHYDMIQGRMDDILVHIGQEKKGGASIHQSFL